jgi:TolB-like protein/Tfp pilus assembly protein PilF
MVTGELPFKGDYDQAMVYSILNESPEPFKTDIPDTLKTVIDTCLEKNPAERYQDAGDLIDDLTALKNGSATVAKRKVRTKSKLKPILLSASIIIVLTIITIGYLFIPFDIFKKTGDTAFRWENSIAVLPFDDLSPEGDQEWFCDGMTEQIISNLAKLTKLKVISRKSVMKFRDTDKTVPEIGKELNVAHILEGSIRKIGEKIRVTAQLINTKDDYHLWSDDYDKDYNDLFALQDDVSERIASSLLHTLSSEDIAKVKKNKPKNLEAWEYYSRGRHIYGEFFLNMERIEFLHKSEEMLKKAIELDKDYIPAYALIVEIYNTYYNFVASTDDEHQKYLNLEEKYIKAGYTIDPQSAYMDWANGSYLWDKGDPLGAYNSYKKSVLKEPFYYDAIFSLGFFYMNKGLYHSGMKLMSRVIELDPISLHGYRTRSIGYDAIGDLEKAEQDILKAMDIFPDEVSTLRRYAWYLIQLDKIEKAKEILNKLEKLLPDDNDWKVEVKSVLYALNGDKEKAMQNWEKLNEIQQYPNGLMMICYLFKLVDEAIEYLNVGIENGNGPRWTKYLFLRNSDLYDFIRSDPRFQKILEEEKKIYDANSSKFPDIEI